MRRDLFLPLVLLALIAGCDKTTPSGAAPGKRRVVVYTALDRIFSEPIFREFTERTGIEVVPLFDAESTKTVGLANRIREERDRPRCDVFWNNEILNTLKLKAEGLLSACRPEEAKNYPPEYKDAAGYWYGFAARARTIIVNTDLVPGTSFPRSIHDLADPKWKGRTGIAKPLFGTTASHIASLFATLGDERASDYLQSLKANDVQVHGGNKGCAVAVARGEAAFALTDTDDAIIELEAGRPVRIVYPDIEPGGMGTLFLPNTLALVKGAPHPVEALELINFLLTREVEQRLAASPSAQIPLHVTGKHNPRVKGPKEIKPLKVDFEKAAAAFDRAREVVEKEFLE